MIYKDRNSISLDSETAAEILEHVFERAGITPNTIPVGELESYSIYKKETYLFQRIVLAFALLVFVLLPFFFISPKFTVNYQSIGERGLPVYYIDVDNRLSIRSVTASAGNNRLPVYPVDSHSFTIEPVINGEIEVKVTLVNGQYEKQTLYVQSFDQKAPEIGAVSYLADGRVEFVIRDSESGVDYESIYALDTSGNKILPIEYDTTSGIVIFDENVKDCDIYASDNYRNVLHVKL